MAQNPNINSGGVTPGFYEPIIGGGNIGNASSMSDEQIRADHQRRLAGMVGGASASGSVAYAPQMVVDTVAIRKFAIDLTWKHAACAKNAVEEAELLVQYIINGKPA